MWLLFLRQLLTLPARGLAWLFFSFTNTLVQGMLLPLDTTGLPLDYGIMVGYSPQIQSAKKASSHTTTSFKSQLRRSFQIRQHRSYTIKGDRESQTPAYSTAGCLFYVGRALRKIYHKPKTGVAMNSCQRELGSIKLGIRSPLLVN